MGRKRPTCRMQLRARWLLSQEPGSGPPSSAADSACLCPRHSPATNTCAACGQPQLRPDSLLASPPLYWSSFSWGAEDGPAGTRHAVKRLPVGTHCLIYKGGRSFWSLPSDYNTLHCEGSPAAVVFPVRVYRTVPWEGGANWNPYHDPTQRA